MRRVYVRSLSAVVIVVIGLTAGATRPVPIRAQAQAQAQVPERLPAFDVVSVKQNISGDVRTSFGASPGGRLVATNQRVRDLIAVAFEMFDSRPLVRVRILGGPDWIDADRFDIEAKASA